jgi:D-arabinose 1-dehydrogenase-like Zn-dependent alcohol dehydrogenase
MPDQASFEEAAALVIGGGTAYEGLIDRGRLQAGETVLITAAAGGVGSAAVQIAAAVGARPLGVASPGNHDYLRASAPVRCLTTTLPTGPSRCALRFPAASTCFSTAPAARPATKHSARCATAAGRSS